MKKISAFAFALIVLVSTATHASVSLDENSPVHSRGLIGLGRLLSMDLSEFLAKPIQKCIIKPIKNLYKNGMKACKNITNEMSNGQLYGYPEKDQGKEAMENLKHFVINLPQAIHEFNEKLLRITYYQEN